MIRLPRFTFYAPSTVAEASGLLAGPHAGRMAVLAGGSGLMVALKQQVLSPMPPQGVVWLGKIYGLQEVSCSPDQGLTIGSMATLAKIGQDPGVRRYYPSIVNAIRRIASPQIRNRATLGGNLCLDTRCIYYNQSGFWRNALGNCLREGAGVCHAGPGLHSCTAVFVSDLAPLLIALGASVELCSAEPALGRTIPLSLLYTGDGARPLALAKPEILTRVSVPYDPSARATHLKLSRRGAIDFPMVNVAVAARFPVQSGGCSHVRILVGGIGSAPFDAGDEAGRLAGSGLYDDAIVSSVAEEIGRRVIPMPNADGSVHYRKKMAGVLVRRALLELRSGQQALQGSG